VTAPARQRVVILGGAGSGLIVAESIRAQAAAGAAVTVLGFLDDHLVGTRIGDFPVVGLLDEWCTCPPDAVFISTIMNAKTAFARHARIKSLAIPPERWAVVTHPAAHVAESVLLGPGSYIGPGAVVEPNARTGMHAFVRGGSYVSHDVTIGDFVFVGPNATLLARTKVGNGAHIGPNAVCHETRSIGDYAVVGMGAVVLKDVPDFAVVVGNPARVIQNIDVAT
jgi:acetyltransferase EpsM